MYYLLSQGETGSVSSYAIRKSEKMFSNRHLELLVAILGKNKVD